MAPDDLVGQAQLGTHGSHLVLEQVAEGFDQIELHVLGQPPHIVMTLDLGRVLGARLDYIRIKRSLD